MQFYPYSPGDLEWSNTAVLFNYLPNGLPVEIKANATANFNAKVQ